jgi:hypothetical protein
VDLTPTRLVARLMWALPALLFFLTLHQALVAYDLRATFLEGETATAEVVEMTTTNRVDVTLDAVTLRVTGEDGTTQVWRNLSFPHTFKDRIEGKTELEVRVRPGARQEVVMTALMPAHWLIAAGQAGMALIGAVLLFWGIFAWNKYLIEEGDPADANEENAPAGKLQAQR